MVMHVCHYSKCTSGLGSYERHSVTASPRPGQPHRLVTSGASAAVEGIVKENRRVTVNEIARNGEYIGK